MPTTFVDRLVGTCNSERDIFLNGGLKEWNNSVYRRIGDYWNLLAEVPEYSSWAGYNGKSDIKFGSNGEPASSKGANQNQPWSAAFISFVLKESGAGSNFSYAPSHSVYIVKALKEAAKSNPTSSFIARRHKLYVPKIGDLIACERQPDIDPNFDTYISYVAKKKYQAHCDVVTQVSAKFLITVGGNVSNSVKEKRWPLDSKGMVGNFDPQSTSAMVICIIENRL